ncbi:MAG: hypothetical protein HXX18_02565 [Bacteroidetes bacterium]|nr:hypothetical protein [Bacteroidota bacterium]
MIRAKTKPKVIKKRKNFNRKNGYITVNINGRTENNIEVNDSFIANCYVERKPYFNSFSVNNENNEIVIKVYGIQKPKEIFIGFCIDRNSLSDESVRFYFLTCYLEDSFRGIKSGLGATSYNKPNFVTNVKFDRNTNEVSGKYNCIESFPSTICISGEFKLKLTQKKYNFADFASNEFQHSF